MVIIPDVIEETVFLWNVCFYHFCLFSSQNINWDLPDTDSGSVSLYTSCRVYTCHVQVEGVVTVLGALQVLFTGDNV